MCSMDISGIINIVSGVITSVIIPIIGIFLFYDSKKRKAEAEAVQVETSNISLYAAEWKELYEKKEAKVHELDGKIDSLYLEKEKDRQSIRQLREENNELKLKLQAVMFWKCEVRGCVNREPPTGA